MRDPCYKYATPEVGSKVNFKCNFCLKVTKGGVTRAKKHIVGGYSEVTKCARCPAHVREEIATYMKKKEEDAIAEAAAAANADRDAYGLNIDDDTDGEGEENQGMKRKACSQGSQSCQSSKKGMKSIGPMDMFVKPKASKQTFAKQATINELARKELREQVAQDLATWFYEAGIPFHAAKYPSFKKALDRVGQFGLGLKPPSAYELSVPLLQKKKKQIQDALAGHEEEWAKGCFVLSLNFDALLVSLHLFLLIYLTINCFVALLTSLLFF